MSWLKNVVIGAAVVVVCIESVHADTLWIGESMTGAIKWDGAKVQDPKGDQLQYITDQGSLKSQPFANIQRIDIDGETTFNAAEDAFARVDDKGKPSPDYDTAITNYQSVLNSSVKPWMQTRAAMRLIAAGKAKDRYDAQVAAYVKLLEKSPESAALNKPAQPPEHSQYLDSALASIAKGLEDSKLDDTRKSTLLTLQLQIEQAKGDNAQVQTTLQQLVALGGGTDAMKATLKLSSAKVELQSRQYPQAINDIEQNKQLFTDPDQQVDALFVLAEAKFAVDGEKTDPEVLKDLALNYMRVVAFGGPLTDKPHVAAALLQAGAIEMKLKEPQMAVPLYQQVLRDRAHASPAELAKAQAALGDLAKEAGAVK